MGIFLVLVPKIDFENTKDHGARLGAVGCQGLVSLDSHDAHGWDGIGDAFRRAIEAKILVERYFYVDVVLDEAIILFEPCLSCDIINQNHLECLVVPL